MRFSNSSGANFANSVLEGRTRADAISFASSLPSLENHNQSQNILQEDSFEYLTDRKRSLQLYDCEASASSFMENSWRIKDRLKTVSCLICLCLNIGVDPPDATVPVKPDNCARYISNCSCV